MIFRYKKVQFTIKSTIKRKNTLPINLPTKMLKFVYVWICVFVFQCLYKRETPFPESRYTHFPGAPLVLRIPNVFIASKHLWSPNGHYWRNFKLQFANGSRKRPLLYEQKSAIIHKICKSAVVFLWKHNGILKYLIRFKLKHKSHPSIFLPTDVFTISH